MVHFEMPDNLQIEHQNLNQRQLKDNNMLIEILQNLQPLK